MAHPVVHAEIRSQDPDTTRQFFADLFGWEVASEGAFPGYTFIDTGVEGGTFVAISPRQSGEDEVLSSSPSRTSRRRWHGHKNSVAASFSQPSTFRARVLGCSQTPRATRSG
jgi:catechol 2,3-dioxygenase-like lactoylglutathione lyase family enzyme